MNDTTKTLLTISAVSGVGPVKLKKILTSLANSSFDFQNALEVLKLEYPEVISKASNNFVTEKNFADTQLELAEKHDVQILNSLDSNYPLPLKDSSVDPVILFVKGDLKIQNQNSVAIIGTRNPTQDGIVQAKQITDYFAQKNWSIVSGLAIGCDAIAHQQALDSHGHTIAVLAEGLEKISPKVNQPLAQKILDEGGALVSQFPFQTPMRNSNFVMRDKIQAGMSNGVVMIQSAPTGGSLHASSAALKIERWLAYPTATENDRRNKEMSAAANVIFQNGTIEQKTSILKCKTPDLERLFAIDNTNSLEQLLSIFNNNESQGSLF